MLNRLAAAWGIPCLRLARSACLAGLILAVLTTVQARAQEAPTQPLPDRLTPAAVEAMVARLSDTEVRGILLSELGARAEAVATSAAAPRPSIIDATTDQIRRVILQTSSAISDSPANAAAVVLALRTFLTDLGRTGAVLFLATLVCAIGLGLAIDRHYSRRMVAWQSARGVPTAESAVVPPFPASILVLLRRFLRDAAGGVLALAVRTLVVVAILPAGEARVALTILIWLVFVPRLLYDLLRFFLSPRRADLRLVSLDDGAARFLTRGLVAAVVVFGIGQTFLRLAEEIGGGDLAHGAGFWLNTLVYVVLALVVLLGRTALRALVRGGTGAEGAADNLITRAYPALAVLAILGTWIVATADWAARDRPDVQGGRHLLGLALVLVAPMCDALIRAAVRLVVPPMRGSGPAAEAARVSAVAGGVRIARVIVFGAIILAVAGLWRISLFGVASSGVGEALAQRLIGALMMLLAGYVVWELVRLSINRRLANEAVNAAPANPEALDEGGATGTASRLATVLPPISLTLQVAVVIVTVLMALDHLGVSVTTLLAGAGVLGIAVGFGAQKLVADVVSGMFFLIEDAFRANEYVSSGSMEGTVERLSIRSLHLRQSDGALNCIPYSNISAITNMSRDWGTMKQVFTVPFDTDLEKVRKIFKRIGQDLMANPEYAPAFIQPFKFKGVSAVDDVGIVVRGKFMYRPELSMQYLIQRDIYRRIQADFAAAGIAFARREVRVVAVGDGAGAAAAAVA
ncbi:MAG: mechanosensitive ion channel family protein [Gemmobacter sp.]